MDNQIQTSLVRACRLFLKPIARFLLRYGFGYREFSEIAKWAFVSVAAEEYGIGGRKTNISRISVMTGLSRKEVTRIRSAPVEDLPKIDSEVALPGRVLAIWHRELEFLQDDGTPAVLEVDSRDGSPDFKLLVKRAGGDVPAGAALQEMTRSKAVEITDSGRVRALRRRFVHAKGDPQLIHRFGLRIRDLATTIDYNMHAKTLNTGRFEACADTQSMKYRVVPRLRNLVRDQGARFLEAIDEWLENEPAVDDSSAEDSDDRVTRCGVSVFFFEDTPYQGHGFPNDVAGD